VPRLNAATAQARRDQFLDAARRVAATRGYRTLTVDDVCREAGASKGAFYSHFGSKQDLLIALLDGQAEATTSLINDLEEQGGSSLGRARRFVRAALERGADPAEVQLQADLWSEMASDDTVRERMGDAVRARRKLLAGWIRDADQAGELVDIPANALAAILVALSDGLLLHHALDPAGFRWRNVAKALDALFDGIST
jgi:AcrR family transcriptional regulator